MKTKLLIFLTYFLALLNGFAQNAYLDSLKTIYSDIKVLENKGIAIIDNATKMAIFSAKGKQLTPYIYEKVSYNGKNRWIVKKGEKYALINENAKYVTEFKWDRLKSDPFSHFTIASKDGSFGLIDANGKEILPLEYAFFFSTENGFVCFDGEKWGYFGKDTNWILPLKYEYIHKALEFVSGGDYFVDLEEAEDLPFLVLALANKKGVVDLKGKEILPIKFEEVRFPSDSSLILALNGDTTYFFDEKGKMLESPILSRNAFWHYATGKKAINVENTFSPAIKEYEWIYARIRNRNGIKQMAYFDFDGKKKNGLFRNKGQLFIDLMEDLYRKEGGENEYLLTKFSLGQKGIVKLSEPYSLIFYDGMVEMGAFHVVYDYKEGEESRKFLQGLLDEDYNWVYPFQSKIIFKEHLQGDLFIVSKKRENRKGELMYGVLDVKTKKYVYPLDYESIEYKDGGYELIKNGKIIFVAKQ